MKCKKQGCNRTFKNIHNMKIHYYQMHIRTPEEYNAKIEKMKLTKANRPQKEKEERIRKLKETMANRTPEEKAKIAEKISKKMKITLAKKPQKEKDDIIRRFKETVANKSPEEKAEIVRKIKETKNNWTPEQKARDTKRRQDAWKNKPQSEKDDIKRRELATKAKRTPEQIAKIREKRKKAWKNMSQEKKEIRYLRTLATWKKHGKCKNFMGEWYQSILEANIAKLLWKNLGCVFMINVNREFPINGGRVDFYPRILGCFIEQHPMDTPYEHLLVSQRNDYKKRRIDMKNKNGYKDTELIHYINYKEAKESIEWISNKIIDYSPKELLHSIVKEHEQYRG